MTLSKVYVIPCLLGESNPSDVLPPNHIKTVEGINHFVVENEKSARRFIKTILPDKVQSDLHIRVLDKHTLDTEVPILLSPLRDDKLPIGLISEAGMPGIADPGARLIWQAHQENIPVTPLVGPSSIFLALASSGFNGQSFSFHGYLPIDKKDRQNAIKSLESKSKKFGSAEIFMETPYRNNNFLADLIKNLSVHTKLCVACDITLPTEFIFSGSIQQWRNMKVDLHKRPAIYILQG